MQPRKDLIELFSTFVQLTDDRFSRWVVDARLQRNMKRTLLQAASSPSDPQAFWVLYWHQHWSAQVNPLAQGHLAAYLQETCYWTVQKMMEHHVSVQYKLSDCFQIAIANLPTLLKGYSPSLGASLKTYASLSFSNIIRDTLRHSQEFDSRTDWGLLRKVSRKQLIEALEAAGLSPEMIACYRLAWNCFKICYAPNQATHTRRLARPEQNSWAAIASLYNQQRSLQLPADAPVATPELLESWLKRCARHIRAYLNPPSLSLNVSKSDEMGGGEMLDDLADSSNESPLMRLIIDEAIQERQTQQSQISTVLMQAMDSLDTQAQMLLNLYYRQGCTQQQIAAQLNVKQYTVSRRLSSAKTVLLRFLTRWSEETLHITPTSPVVKQISIVLEEWLQHSLMQEEAE
jgi:RNA polymerase sigma factor (sigma-70 family)